MLVPRVEGLDEGTRQASPKAKASKASGNRGSPAEWISTVWMTENSARCQTGGLLAEILGRTRRAGTGSNLCASPERRGGDSSGFRTARQTYFLYALLRTSSRGGTYWPLSLFHLPIKGEWRLLLFLSIPPVPGSMQYAAKATPCTPWYMWSSRWMVFKHKILLKEQTTVSYRGLCYNGLLIVIKLKSEVDRNRIRAATPQTLY